MAADVLKKERDRFVKLAFCRADLLFELSEDLDILFAAGATPVLFGAAAEDLVGRSFLDCIGDEHRNYAKDLLAVGGSEGRIDDAILDIKTAAGGAVPVAVAGYRAPEFGEHVFLALKVEPAATSHVAADSLRLSDDSGLMDQESFSRVAAERVQAYARAGGTGRLSLVRIRNIRDLTESMGASDRHALMAAIGDVLKTHSIGGNTAGQIDGENFGYVHGQDVDPEEVNMEIEETAQRFLPGNENVSLRSATLVADGASMTEDQVAKALVHTMQEFCAGKAKISADRLSDSLDELMNGTVDKVKYIQSVTHDQSFDLHFMPICDLRLGKVHHFEALSRFRDAERAKSTFQIITLAEELDLIIDFDYAVVDKTIKQLATLVPRGFLPSIAVNISSISLGNDAFVERLHNRVDGDPALTSKLMFELTESAEIDDLSKINGAIQSFRARGFSFSLDDFGAGSASFDYLNALEVDVVKFDGPVVRRACASKRGNDLLTTMTKMCTNAGIQTVAEMVEDKKVANQVFYCGIDYGQGWYFGKPSPDPFAFAENFAGRAE